MDVMMNVMLVHGGFEIGAKGKPDETYQLFWLFDTPDVMDAPVNGVGAPEYTATIYTKSVHDHPQVSAMTCSVRSADNAKHIYVPINKWSEFIEFLLCEEHITQECADMLSAWADETHMKLATL